jgi:hypothetical protein
VARTSIVHLPVARLAPRSERKHFFFKKKKQKTSDSLLSSVFPGILAQINKSFLLPRAGRLFFKKEVLSFITG